MNHQMQGIENSNEINLENIVNRLISVKCTIMQKGFKKTLSEYIYCSCDPEHQDPICEVCFDKCHVGHKLQFKKRMIALCSCGSKSHQIQNIAISKDMKSNSTKCPMMDWNNTLNNGFFYVHNNSNKKICLYCANFCQIPIEELMKKNYNIKNKSNPDHYCECTYEDHNDNKNFFKNLKNFQDPRNYNFEGISKTHFFNLIVKSENSFDILFKNYKNLLEAFKSKVEISVNNPNSPSSILTDSMIIKDFNLYLSLFSWLTEKCHRLNYFSNKISQVFNQNFLYSFMNMRSEYKSSNVWFFKLNFITVFLNTHFKRDIAIAPNMKVQDIEILNPFQRMMYINNIKSQNEIMSKYINNLKFNFLEFTLKILNELNSAKEIFNVSFTLMKKLFIICKTYSKFNLFNYEQAIKYANIIEDIMIKFSNFIKNFKEEGNAKDKILEEQILLIKPIVKSIFYLSFYYNDQVAEKYFRSLNNSREHSNTQNLKFFNTNLELTKFMSKNIIICLTNILNNPNINCEKGIKKIVSNISSILKTFIYTKDGYSTGLKRILHKNNSIYFKYTMDNLEESESNFINELRYQTNEIEKTYTSYFNFESEEDDVISVLKNSLKKTFDLMNLSKYRQAVVMTEHMQSSFSENDGDKSNNFNYIILSQGVEKLSVFPRPKTLQNALTKNEGNNDNIFDKSENNQLNMDGSMMFFQKNFETIGKYKILINKSFLIFSVIKIIKISFAKYNRNLSDTNANKDINNNNDYSNTEEDFDYNNCDFAIDNVLFDEILKLLYFYVENNADNSIILLTSDFLEAFVLLNNQQLNEIFGVIYLAMKNIVKLKFELATHIYILKFFKKVLQKVNINPEKLSKDFKIFLKIFKLLKLLLKINFINESLVSHKLRKFITYMFTKYTIISDFIDFLKQPYNFNLKTSEYETDLISEIDNKKLSKNMQNIIQPDQKNGESNRLYNENINIKENINIESYLKNFEVSNKNNKRLTANYDDDIYQTDFKGIKVKDLSTILRYFLSLTNLLFNRDASFNKKDFLCTIFSINDIVYILKRKNLDIELRKEILIFFRMVYIDVIFEKKKILNYLYILVDKKNPTNESEYLGIESCENKDIGNLYNFMNDLISINQNTLHSDLEYEILKSEFLNEEEVIEKNKGSEDYLKLEFLVEGIILPMRTHMSKFLSKLNKFNGADYLKLYELVYFFLNLKKKILNNEDYLSVLKTRYNFKDIFEISNLHTVEKFIPLKKNYSLSELEDLNKDINLLKNPAFEFYQFEFIINVYNKHMENFLISSKNESLKKEFLKKNYEYDEESLLNLEQKLTHLNFIQTPYEIKAFHFIVNYYNSKRDLTNSGFMNILQENNLQYLNTYCYLISRSIFFILRDESYKEEYMQEGFWILFKLIQYETESVQREVTKLIEEQIDLVDLKDLNFLILENIISIIFTSCNPTLLSFNEDYFIAMNIVKLLKYLCEDHNKEFQRIFFKEINLLIYEKKSRILYSENRKITEARNQEFSIDSNRRNEINNGSSKEIKQVIFDDEQTNRSQISEVINIEHNESILNKNTRENNHKNKSLLKNKIQLNKKKSKDFENLHTNSVGHFDFLNNVLDNLKNQNSNEILSTFEFMLEVVNKIIIIAQWNNVEFGTEHSHVAYYYDIFSVIIEFLIEMIQGTEASNLESLINKKKIQGEGDEFKITVFFQNIKVILLRDETDSQIVYKVRKDLMDFICAFLEEKSSPQKLIKIISTIYNPYLIFTSLINTMKKLYLKLNLEEKKENKFKELSYKKIKFDSNMGKFFEKKFYLGKPLIETSEFELANRMFQYLKILATEYLNNEAIEIVDFINLSNEDLRRYEYEEKNNENNNKSDLNNPINKNDYKKNDQKNLEEEIYNISHREKYESVKFFEKITRTVMIQNNSELVRVVFTINPLIPNLSNNTKTDFLENVSRETRYIKLFSLMEYCDYFYDELIYYSKFSESNLLMKLFKSVNYYTLEFITFIINFLQNFFMLKSLDVGEQITGDETFSLYIEILAFLNLIFCSLVFIVWCYTRFNLYWIIDSKKLALKINIPLENLNFFHKLKIFRNVIFLKGEITAFIWHIIFCSIAVSNRDFHFLFSLEILMMVNLSSVLKNIVKSITLRYQQLLVTFFLFLISNYQFGVFAFYYFSEDFITNFKLPDKTEIVSQNQCGTNFYCFITHLDYGLRSDGGIGEYIPKRSINTNPVYYIGRFLHNTLYFIVVNVILFSILMGIIIDTFAELRELTSKKEEDMADVCFICGDIRENLEKSSKNYLKHISEEHNIWTYAEYIIGLKFLDPQEVNAINSYVIGTVNQKAISWFPHAESDENAEEDESKE